MAVTCRQQLCKESATTQSQQYIVIHNSAGGTAKTVADFKSKTNKLEIKMTD